MKPIKYASVNEALHILYKGQANVAVTASSVGISTEEMKERLKKHILLNPIDPDLWQLDVQICWPYVT